MTQDHPLRFLVIRRDNIGDLVCTTPFLTGLRRTYPDASIDVLVNSYNRDVLTGNPDVDEIHAYTKAKHRPEGQSRWDVYAATLRLLMALRRKKFDYAILATPGYQRHDLVFARLAGARQMIGFVERAHQGIEVGVIHKDAHDLHEVEDIWRLAAPLGIQGTPPGLRVIPDAQRMEALWARLSTDMVKRRGPLVAFHISARKPSQRWPAEQFAALAHRLHERHGAVFMLLWSPGSASNPRHPGDDEKAEALHGRLAGLPVHKHPTPDLAELIAALGASDAVVCSDGGAMHIAAALGKPLVCLFGDSTPSRWRPWQARHELLQAPSRDVADLSADEVAAGYERLMGAR